MRRSDSQFLEDVGIELRQARYRFPDINSPHEGYAVTLEELDEAWQEIKAKCVDHQALYRELVQVAAMAARTAVDVVLPPDGGS